MDSRMIQLTAAAQKYGNLNISSCGESFFPPDAFGGSSRSKGIGVPIIIKAEGLPLPIETDIPADDKKGRPRWIFRKRDWVKKFISTNNLISGNTVTITRLGKRTYEVSCNNSMIKEKHLEKIERPKQSHSVTPICLSSGTIINQPLNNLKKWLNTIQCVDCVKEMKDIPSNCIDLVITSPPYFQQRNYGGVGIGNEKTVEEYIQNLMKIFRECVRIVKETGSIVFNVGDKYIDGNLLLVPYRFVIEAQKEPKIRLLNEITWVKPNPAPKQDPRKLVPSKEPFFLFVKSNKYYFNRSAFLAYKDRYLNGNGKKTGNDIGRKYFELLDQSSLSDSEKTRAKKELQEVIEDVKRGKLESFRMKIRDMHALPYGGQAGGRLTQIKTKGFTIIKIYGHSIRRDIIESTVETVKGNIHPAVYPEFIIQELIKLLTKQHDIVLDPFLGSGTTAVVAKRLRRNYIGIEIFDEYVKYAERRLEKTQIDMEELFI